MCCCSKETAQVISLISAGHQRKRHKGRALKWAGPQGRQRNSRDLTCAGSQWRHKGRALTCAWKAARVRALTCAGGGGTG